MPNPFLPAITVILILACLCAVIVVCFRMLRGAEARLRRLQSPAPASQAPRISGDEIIDLHLALKDVDSLREMGKRTAA